MRCVCEWWARYAQVGSAGALVVHDGSQLWRGRGSLRAAVNSAACPVAVAATATATAAAAAVVMGD